MAIILMAVSFLVIGGMIGLGIDVGVMYFLKARLSQAIDAASLAGARSLARGATIESQRDNAIATAARFFNANFPDKFWGCTVPAPAVKVEDAPLQTRLVTVTASVTAPLYFLRLLGFSTTKLGASGQASRRDVNIMLIMDRSSSMGTNLAIDPSITAATSFVGEFAPGRDKLGMVVFGGDYYLYKPTTNFGPTSGDPLVSEIKQIKASGNTNTSTALWEAYKSLAGLNEPGALNVIVFFTDGLPNGITANMIHTESPPASRNFVDYRTAAAKLTCGSQIDPPPVGEEMVGWFAQWSSFADSGTTAGLFKTTTSTVNDASDGTQPAVIGGTVNAGCKFAKTDTDFSTEFTQFPDYDIYGTPTWDGAPNKPAFYSTAMNPMVLGDIQAGLSSPKRLGWASKNTADFVAQRWRRGEINGVVPLLYGITLTQPQVGEEPDPMFMLRVTNTPSGLGIDGTTLLTNPLYDKTKPTGTYINTKDKDRLQSAFLQIASQILHLTL